MKALLRALPQPPDYAWDWAALRAHPVLAPIMDDMARTMQHPAWHGEGDVWTHTRMVCEELAALPGFRALPERGRSALALAALLHDMGKPRTTRLEEGVLTSPRHGPVGAQMARAMLWAELGCAGTPAAQQFREAVCLLIRHHTLPLHLFERAHPAAYARKVASAGLPAPDFTLKALCLLGEADVRGRIAADTAERLERVALSREQAAEAGCLDGPYPFRSPVTARAYFAGGSVWPDQELYDDSWGEVILLCGLPGTGKDTWIAGHHPDWPTVCLDDLRAELGVRPTDDQGRVAQLARERAKELLRRRQPFIWNATSLTGQRAREIELFEGYGARVRIVYLETPWDENLRRNASRARSVPERVVSGMLGRLEPPLPWEAREVAWMCV